MSLRDRFLAKLRDCFANDPLSLRLIFWDGGAFEFAPEPRVTIKLRSPRLARLFLAGDIARLGQAYVEGEIDVEGRLQEVLCTGVALAERLGRSMPVRLAARLLAHHCRRF